MRNIVNVLYQDNTIKLHDTSNLQEAMKFTFHNHKDFEERCREIINKLGTEKFIEELEHAFKASIGGTGQLQEMFASIDKRNKLGIW